MRDGEHGGREGQCGNLTLPAPGCGVLGASPPRHASWWRPPAPWLLTMTAACPPPGERRFLRRVFPWGDRRGHPSSAARTCSLFAADLDDFDFLVVRTSANGCRGAFLSSGSTPTGGADSLQSRPRCLTSFRSGARGGGKHAPRTLVRGNRPRGAA